ncbi:MAG TPA: hypothetical protein VM532_17250 [Burkholderiales bacterium]|nr:hypothetical protein [Burkholderiales bacterium]
MAAGYTKIDSDETPDLLANAKAEFNKALAIVEREEHQTSISGLVQKATKRYEDALAHTDNPAKQLKEINHALERMKFHAEQLLGPLDKLGAKQKQADELEAKIDTLKTEVDDLKPDQPAAPKIDALNPYHTPALQEATARFDAIYNEANAHSENSAVFSAMERADKRYESIDEKFPFDLDKRAEALQNITDKMEAEVTSVVGEILAATTANLADVQSKFEEELAAINNADIGGVRPILEQALKHRVAAEKKYPNEPSKQARELNKARQAMAKDATLLLGKSMIELKDAQAQSPNKPHLPNMSPALEEALARFDSVVDEVQRLDQRRSAIIGPLESAQNGSKQLEYTYVVDPDNRAKQLQKLTDKLEMEATRAIGRPMTATQVNLEKLKLAFWTQNTELRRSDDEQIKQVAKKAEEKLYDLDDQFQDSPIKYATQLRSLIDQTRKNAVKVERENTPGLTEATEKQIAPSTTKATKGGIASFLSKAWRVARAVLSFIVDPTSLKTIKNAATAYANQNKIKSGEFEIVMRTGAAMNEKRATPAMGFEEKPKLAPATVSPDEKRVMQDAPVQAAPVVKPSIDEKKKVVSFDTPESSVIGTIPRSYPSKPFSKFNDAHIDHEFTVTSNRDHVFLKSTKDTTVRYLLNKDNQGQLGVTNQDTGKVTVTLTKNDGEYSATKTEVPTQKKAPKTQGHGL